MEAPSYSYPEVNLNYLQLFYREVQGILLYNGFPSPILSSKHPERKEGCSVDKFVEGTRVVKFFISEQF